jgi:hypothetical protein
MRSGEVENGRFELEMAQAIANEIERKWGIDA